MSIVGTRPPTLDEWNKYELHHRARLSIKPGITGMWQVSGRSEITDFEEVVKLDTEYISEWNVEMDMKILWKSLHFSHIDKGLLTRMAKYSVVLIPNSFMWWIMNSSDRIMVSSILLT